MSTMRLMAWVVSCVCSVPRIRWPLSASVSANCIVSMSRISPPMITSGDWRNTPCSASGNDGASS